MTIITQQESPSADRVLNYAAMLTALVLHLESCNCPIRCASLSFAGRKSALCVYFNQRRPSLLVTCHSMSPQSVPCGLSFWSFLDPFILFISINAPGGTWRGMMESRLTTLLARVVSEAAGSLPRDPNESRDECGLCPRGRLPHELGEGLAACPGGASGDTGAPTVPGLMERWGQSFPFSRMLCCVSWPSFRGKQWNRKKSRRADLDSGALRSPGLSPYVCDGTTYVNMETLPSHTSLLCDLEQATHPCALPLISRDPALPCRPPWLKSPAPLPTPVPSPVSNCLSALKQAFIG